MRALGAFQMSQMKHRDRRVFEMCQHLRAAIDVFEQIAAEPYQPPERSTPERVESPPPAPPPQLPAEKLMYTVKQVSEALGVGRTTVWKVVAEGKLRAIKLGNRTLLPAEHLRAWIASMPAVKRSA